PPFVDCTRNGAKAKDPAPCPPTQDGFPTAAVWRRIPIQEGGRHRRWRWADARRWRTCLLGVDHGEQLPHGARRQAPSVSLRWIVSASSSRTRYSAARVRGLQARDAPSRPLRRRLFVSGQLLRAWSSQEVDRSPAAATVNFRAEVQQVGCPRWAPDRAGSPPFATGARS